MRLGAEVAGCPTAAASDRRPAGRVCCLSKEREGWTTWSERWTFQEGRGKDSNSSSKVGTSPPALELGARPSGTSLPLATFGPHVRHTRHVPKRRSSLERGSRRVSSKASRKKGEWRCGSHLFSPRGKDGGPLPAEGEGRNRLQG